MLLAGGFTAASGGLTDDFCYASPQPGDARVGYTTLGPESSVPLVDYEPLSSVSYDADISELLEQLDEELMYSYIENLTSFGPRVTTSPAIENASVYIYNEFSSMGLDVRYQDWNWEDHDLYGRNIEATLPGDDPESEFIFVVCGHYDSVSGSPGADDDASGVAAVLAAASIMSQYSFNHTVRFVAFSGEEQGLVGSYYYVEESYENNDQIVATLNADMISYAENPSAASKIKIYENEASEWVTQYTAAISETYADQIELEVLPSGPSSGSDHYRFWEFGYDAIFYFEYTFNPYYHSPEDVIEHCNMTYAKRVGRLILGTLADIAQSRVGFPVLEVTIMSGGPGVHVVVTNVGTAEAVDVDWRISLNGGLVLLGKQSNGTIPEIPIGESAEITHGPVLGLGKTEIIASVEGKQDSAQVFLFFLFIFGLNTR